jgi:hypothetical protein
MVEPNDPSRPSSAVRQPVLLGLFAGTAVGGGYLLAWLPNVEIMTVITAVAGVVLGPVLGFLCGAMSAGIYSIASPMGAAPPLLLLAQMLGMGLAGPVGHVAAGRVDGVAGRVSRRAVVRAAAGGLVATVLYDALTNLAGLLIFDLPLPVVLVGAVPFFLVHAASNVAIFAVFLPVLAPRMAPLARPRVTGRPGTPGAAACLTAGLIVATATLAAAPGLAQESPPETGVVVPAVADTAAAVTAAPDTSIVSAAVEPVPVPGPAPVSAVGGAPGWTRPLWQPFNPTWLAWADRESPWLTFVDGGVGATSRLSGEGGTSPMPLVVRDGVPLGTGHVLADDAWFVGIEGVTATAGGLGADGWGGTGGVVELVSRDVEPRRAVSSYRGVKGRHESYYRGVDFLSPRADWRIGFTFEESLDNEGYNHTNDPDEVFLALRADGQFPGQGKVRQSRTRLQRAFADGSELSVEFGTGRRTRDELPALAAGSLEAWDRSAAVRMRWLPGAWDVRPVLFWNERDVLWGPRWTSEAPPDDLRLLESGRQGARVDIRRRTGSVAAAPAAADVAPATAVSPRDTLAAGADSASVATTDSTSATTGDAPADTALLPDAPATTGLPLVSLSIQDWTLRDSGTRLEWAGADTQPVAGRGGEARLAFGWEGALAGAHAQAELGALASGPLGWGPDARLALAQRGVDPRWQAALEWGGRAPRSDELLTHLRQVVAGRTLVVLPNNDLEREQSVRASLVASTRVAGLELAATGSARHLANGIAWRAETDEPDRGRWTNELELTSWRLTTSVARAGRFLGWARLLAEGTWQGFDVASGPTVPLPPAQWQRLRLDWENHFFKEDGILQLSLLATRRAASADPWDVTGTWQLPARTNLDLLVGFRLVGAHLTMGFRNLTGTRQQLTSGALSPGMETDLRLEWGFRQ